MKRSEKRYTIEVKGQEKVISLDCLKPAYLDTSDSNTPQSPAPTHTLPPIPHPPNVLRPTPTPPTKPCLLSPTHRSTRSGRRVHFPDRLNL